MPILEDVLYKPSKARVFTLVDARDAFLQCKLDEDRSCRMPPVWLPWGRMRWLKRPFGLSVVPEMYQLKQRELLGDLEPIADDILVAGCGDSNEKAECENDNNLREALMERCREVRLRLSVLKLQFSFMDTRA